MIRWVLLIVLSLIWGSSFILIHDGLKVFTPMQLAMFRMFSAGLTLFIFALPHLFKVEKQKWKYIILSGLTGNFFPAILFALAEKGLDSGVTGVLNALTPIFTLLIAVFIYKTKTQSIQRWGVFVGFLGCAGVVWASHTVGRENPLLNAFYVILATLCYGISVNIIKQHLSDIKALTLSSLALFSVFIPAGIYLFSTDFVYKIQLAENNNAFYAVLCLGVVGSAISLVLFNRLVQLSSALFASSVTYTIPIVALAWGVYVGEQLNVMHFLSICLILVGIYLVNKRQST